MARSSRRRRLPPVLRAVRRRVQIRLGEHAAPGARVWRTRAENRIEAQAPGLNLLVELEPRRVVFVRNLAEILAGRSAPPLPAGSTAPFWPDVFIESRIPWWWFLESLLCHVIMVAFVVILSQVWTQPEPSQRRIFDRSYISYYQPSDTFPALRSSPPRHSSSASQWEVKGKAWVRSSIPAPGGDRASAGKHHCA